MNQPPGSFDPPDDGYGGMGRKGGTIPGGPPIEIPGVLEGSYGGTQVGGAVQGGGPAPTLVDHAVSPVAFGQPGVPASPVYPPVYPLPQPGPIGYAPIAPPRRRSSSGSGLGVVFGIGFVVLLIGGGAAGAVIFARGISSTTEESEAPILTFAPPSTIEAEGEYAAAATDPTGPSEPLPEDLDPTPPPPPPATTKTTRPPAPTRPPSTTTATTTATATSTATAPPTATATATTTSTATRRPPPFIIGPPKATATSTATSTGTATSTSTGRRPPLMIPGGGFKIPKPK